MPKGEWKIISRQDVSVHPKWLRAERLTVDTGRAIIKDYFVTYRDPCVIVIAQDAGGKVICTREWSQGAGRRLLRFPSGIMEGGEKPEEAAVRELREETGFTPIGLRLECVTMPAPECNVREIFVFTAGKTEPGAAHPEDSEDIEIVLLSPRELDEIAGNGGIVPSEQAAAWLAARKRFVK